MAIPNTRAGNKSFRVKGKTVRKFTPTQFKGQKKAPGGTLASKIASRVASARSTPRDLANTRASQGKMVRKTDRGTLGVGASGRTPLADTPTPAPEVPAPGAYRPDLGMSARGPNVVGPTTSNIGSGQGQSRRKKLPRPPGGRGTLAGVVRRRRGARYGS